MLAAPVDDCPLRDAPYSVDSPMIDILLKPEAKAVLDGEAPGKFAKAPPGFLGTSPPTFAAILTVRQAQGFLAPGLDLSAIDAKLRAIPVIPADRVKRCARYDNDVPNWTMPAGRPRVLVFEKINGFKDVPSVEAAHAAFQAMARRNGWALIVTDKGGAFNPATLKRFDVVIWNNVSGDVLTLAQRRTFQRWIEGGGGYVAVHGSAGDPVYFWDWYADRLLGARFAGHPMAPQFQDAKIVTNKAHPLAGKLPSNWIMNDEWYSFKTNPRSAGADVLLTLDEGSYKLAGPPGVDLSMKGDHPIAWTNCIGRGRMFYSAIGHRPETYAQPNYVALLEAAVPWAADRGACKHQ
ncbi:ThuA domain-containing protein [Sphingomonas tabacisoli]|uniref:ThuA domain-containing protein n=1 Tax=Sphingomonas tabacisoli TaxID=2249466 RepID=A0ABW4I2H6_9SPHN